MRIITRLDDAAVLQLTGEDADRPTRNQLRVRWLAQQCAGWIERGVEVREATRGMPQAVYVADHVTEPTSRCVITGACSFTSDGLGLTPGDQLGLVQCTETPEEAATFGS